MRSSTTRLAMAPLMAWAVVFVECRARSLAPVEVTKCGWVWSRLVHRPEELKYLEDCHGMNSWQGLKGSLGG